MPPTLGKRTFPQSTSEPTPEPIQGTAIVVIHPGSFYLRIGRAADPFPQTIPHCIARKQKQPLNLPQESWLFRPECQHSTDSEQCLSAINQAQEYLRYRPTKSQGFRRPTSHTELSELNKGCGTQQSESSSTKQWTDTQLRQNYFVGEEALHINPQDPYELSWPIRCGQLNVRPDVASGSLTAILQDLEHIWATAISEYLDIPLKDLKHYRAVLLIPDIYDHHHVKLMVNLLLTTLGFGAAFVHQESVCATFGAGVPSACVLDVGDQKASVCCVEDGLSQSRTRLTMHYGGRDITRCLHWLLTRCGFPSSPCDPRRNIDALFLQDIKESLCHMDQDTFGDHEEQLTYECPGRPVIQYSLQIGDETIIAPMGMFCPDMFALSGSASQLWRVAKKTPGDGEDPHDDDYILQTRSRQEESARSVAARKKESTNPDSASATASTTTLDGSTCLDESTMDLDDDTNEPPEGSDIVGGMTLSKGQRPEEEENLFDLSKGLLGVDRAILQSIDKCDTDDMKRRMYGCIVVVGGGLSKFVGAPGWIKYSVWTQMPKQYRFGLETMDVLTQPKEMDPMMACWKGGAILSCFDTAQELWIRQSEWKRWGVRMLRERAPFVW